MERSRVASCYRVAYCECRFLSQLDQKVIHLKNNASTFALSDIVLNRELYFLWRVLHLLKKLHRYIYMLSLECVYEMEKWWITSYKNRHVLRTHRCWLVVRIFCCFILSIRQCSHKMSLRTGKNYNYIKSSLITRKLLFIIVD